MSRGPNHLFIQSVDEFQHYILRDSLVGMFHVGHFSREEGVFDDDELSWELIKSTSIDDYGNLELTGLMCGHSEGSYKHGGVLPTPSKAVMEYYEDPSIPMPWWGDEILGRYESVEAARTGSSHYDPTEEHFWGNTGEFPEGGILFISPELGNVARCIINQR